MRTTLLLALLAGIAAVRSVAAQTRTVLHAPDRPAGEGEGPYARLIIRGVTIIDGTGAPPMGPADVVIENNRIASIAVVGYPKVANDPKGRPQGATREIDAIGMYLLPGFVDTHAHIGGADQGTPAEYVYKLWLAHGVTTIRDPGCMNGVEWCLEAGGPGCRQPDHRPPALCLHRGRPVHRRRGSGPRQRVPRPPPDSGRLSEAGGLVEAEGGGRLHSPPARRGGRGWRSGAGEPCPARGRTRRSASTRGAHLASHYA